MQTANIYLYTELLFIDFKYLRTIFKDMKSIFFIKV